jgi:hypothetical protein
MPLVLSGAISTVEQTFRYLCCNAFHFIEKANGINFPRPYGRGFYLLNFVALHLKEDLEDAGRTPSLDLTVGDFSKVL